MDNDYYSGYYTYYCNARRATTWPGAAAAVYRNK